MGLAQFYFRIYFLNTVRNTPALFFTLIFPPLMLLITAHQWGPNALDKISAFVIFLNYSVQTVALMLLGMGVSQEKNSHWAKYLRSLPVPTITMIMGRLWHTLFLSLLNLVTISLVGIFLLSIPVTLPQLSYFFLIALLGGIPMALMGMTIGYAANAESSRSIFTLLNLLLLFGSFSLPSVGFLGYFRLIVPTYQWRMLSLKIIDPTINALTPLICLFVCTLIFVFLFQKVYFRRKK